MSIRDWVDAQALGHQSKATILLNQRAKLEGDLATQRAKVDALRTAVEASEAGLPTELDPSLDVSAIAATVVGVARAKLEELGKARKFAAQAFEVFRLGHGICCPPKVVSVLEAAMILALGTLIEGGLNAIFVVRSDMVPSMASGLVLSLTISLVNVAISATAGYFCGRWVRYGANAAEPDDSHFQRVRLMARAGVVLFTGAAAFFHLQVGLVRALERIEFVPHGVDAYLRIVETPEASFLVLLGACMSVFAFHKGRTGFNDPYGGYGEHWHAVEKARQAFEDAFEDVIQQLGDALEEAREEFENTLKAVRNRLEVHNKIASKFRDASVQLDRVIEDAGGAMRLYSQQLDDQYRAASGKRSGGKSKPDEALISFGGFRADNLPIVIRLPDGKAAREALAAEKSKALNEISAIYQRCRKTAQGEEHETLDEEAVPQAGRNGRSLNGSGRRVLRSDLELSGRTHA